MALAVSTFNDVKCYNLSAGKSTPQFIDDATKKKKSLRYNEEYRRRIEVLQDFEFPIASTRVRVSRDGQFICATGIYKPELRMFDTKELGMKFSRHIDAEVVDLQFLSDDYKKVVLLGADRSIEFHAQYGRHHKVRIPKVGRTLCYVDESCNLFVGASAHEIYRLDLEQGQFLAPLVSSLEFVNQVSKNPCMPLLGCAGSDGLVECWDTRAPKAVANLLTVFDDDDLDNGKQAYCLDWSASGMHMVVGTSSGMSRLFDLRSHKPFAERDQRNGLPVRSIRFHTPQTGKQLVASMDDKAIKLWKADESAELITTVESESKLNDFCFCENSGLLLAAIDQPRIGAYFLPQLGVAPRWCSFLDSMTEELEENPDTQLFDDYQFVSRETLEQLSAEDLIGSKFLKPYMHGYFMEAKMFQKLKMASEPFAYEEYRKKKIQEKVDKKRKMRITIKQPKVSVNERLHKKLRENVEDGTDALASQKGKKSADKASALLADVRFQQLFSNPDFEIEETKA
eukprot:GEMP01048139.1.p1 GENE.GEMP01048139.1~~GEMP01048139.1.p1  ORF type:complete len:511 (-),score=109.87 GEMP01048139.1:61-1593(-)